MVLNVVGFTVAHSDLELPVPVVITISTEGKSTDCLVAFAKAWLRVSSECHTILRGSINAHIRGYKAAKVTCEQSAFDIPRRDLTKR